MELLTLRGVTKSFGRIDAVKELDLSVEGGSIYGLLGPNGAGKTTTIRMIMDILAPDRGEILILGQPNSSSIRDRVGYLPEERGLYRKMKVEPLLHFLAELKGMRRGAARERIGYWLERFDLSAWRAKKVEELSRGMQQKLQFIATLLHSPQLAILDEPFTGLDPVNINLVKEVMLEEKKKGASIILSTHLMEQAEKLCDQICLISEGEKVLDGNLKEIKANYGKNTVVLEYEGQARFLSDREMVESYDDYGRWVEVHPSAGVDPQEILRRAAQEVAILKFELVEPSLNEIFIKTVRKGER